MAEMAAHKLDRTAGKWLARCAVAGLASYGAYVGIAWLRYGRDARGVSRRGGDELLDRFMPVYEVAERHSIQVAAPAAATFSIACRCSLEDTAIVRAILKVREIVFRSQARRRIEFCGLLEQMRSLGWGLLAEIPDREVVLGAVTQPWAADVVFRAIPADEFAAFCDPGYAKIAWTLRADSAATTASIARTETRVQTTDEGARAKFRGYWSFVSPGIFLIRWAMLRQIKREAERAIARSAARSSHRTRRRCVPFQ